MHTRNEVVYEMRDVEIELARNLREVLAVVGGKPICSQNYERITAGEWLITQVCGVALTLTLAVDVVLATCCVAQDRARFAYTTASEARDRVDW